MIIKNKFLNMNVATSENYSINKIANIALKKHVKQNLKIEYDPSKPNGQMRKDIDIRKMKKFSQYKT